MTEWNKYHESLLHRWAETSKTYATMHSLSSHYYGKWDKRLGIPVIILGAATASSIFSTGGNEQMVYVNGSLTLIITALTGISKFLGLSEKQVKHATASFKYTNIAMTIDAILSFPREQREKTPKEFLEKIRDSILDIRENTPDVRQGVLANYLAKFDKTLIDTKTSVCKTEAEGRAENIYSKESEQNRDYIWRESSESPQKHETRVDEQTEKYGGSIMSYDKSYPAILKASAVLRSDDMTEMSEEGEEESQSRQFQWKAEL